MSGHTERNHHYHRQWTGNWGSGLLHNEPLVAQMNSRAHKLTHRRVEKRGFLSLSRGRGLYLHFEGGGVQNRIFGRNFFFRRSLLQDYGLIMMILNEVD